MSPNGRLWLIASGAALAGALIGAGVVWAMQQPTIVTLNARIIKADADTQAALQRIEELTDALDAAGVTGSATATITSDVASSTPAVPKKKAAAKPVKTVRQFAFIKKVIEAGARAVVVADYAQMLSGDAAAAAATARGDESPPPNDYYIVNDNKLLRSLKVQPGITVTVTTNSDGTTDPTGHIVTFANWAANYSAPTADNAGLRTAPYWITIKGGVVTKITQQYLP